MQIKTSNKSGFTLAEIMIVVAIIGLLATIAIPNFNKARETSQQKSCIDNLKQIEGAKANWSLESKQVGTALATAGDLYGADKYVRDEPICPAAFAYTIGSVNTKEVCSALVASGHLL